MGTDPTLGGLWFTDRRARAGGAVHSGDGDRPVELGAPDPTLAVMPRRRAAPVFVVVLAAIAMVATVAVVMARSDSGDVEVAVDEDVPTSPTTSPLVREVAFPTPIALGGPTDGKESIGLPVRAEPSTGLLDGQEVTVTGTGFPPGVSIGVVMCTREAGREHGARGVDACNIGHFAQTTSSEDGVAVATFSVRRIVVLDGHEVDCASEAQRCLLGMGMISDYDTSGGVLVDFDPSVPLPDPPSATVEPARRLVDGDRVEVRVGGLTPGGSVSASLCDEGKQMCIELGRGAHGTADRAGDAVLDLRVWRQFALPMWEPDRPARNVDCATERCVLEVWGESPGSRTITPVILGFDPAGPKRTAPTLTVEPGPHRAGEEIRFVLGPVPAGTVAEPVVCSPRGCQGGMASSDQVGDELRVRFRFESVACSERPCTLGVHLYGPGEGTPPLLVPAPVELDIPG
jgi:hypothetical protein